MAIQRNIYNLDNTGYIEELLKMLEDEENYPMEDFEETDSELEEN